MELIVERDYDAMSRTAADFIVRQLASNPASVIGLATGSTPEGLYACLVADCAAGKVSFAHATTFNLDEYRGLSSEDEHSYRFFMDDHLFDHVDIDRARTHVPAGDVSDADAVCNAYEQAIRDAGGIDLQLLGIGHDGHIGFNEPADAFPVTTHAVALAEPTIKANSRLFDAPEDVPREAYTMGIGTIMAARAIVLVASGSDKAQVVHDAFFGPVTPRVPASVLQLHPNATIILDKEAAALCA